jgi:Protein of unknown function (DUF2442)
MKNHHKIENLRFKDDDLFITIDGEEKKIRLNKVSSVLEKASEAERNEFQISPSGYGVHWPLLDEDISVDGLLGIAHSPSEKRKIA